MSTYLENLHVQLCGLKKLLGVAGDDPIQVPQLKARIAAFEKVIAEYKPSPEPATAPVPVVAPLKDREHSPEPWIPWYDVDKDGFIYQAGVDSGPNREVGICEVLVENIEYDDVAMHNAMVMRDLSLIAAAPVLRRALQMCVTEWGPRDLFLLQPEKVALAAARDALALVEKDVVNARTG